MKKTEDDKQQKGVANRKEAFHLAGAGVDIAALSLRLAEVLRTPPPGLDAACHALPPLRLVLDGFCTLLDIFNTAFLEKGKKLTRGARIGLNIAFLATGIAILAVPHVITALVIAGSAVSLIKTTVHLGEQTYSYVKDWRRQTRLQTEIDKLDKLLAEEQRKTVPTLAVAEIEARRQSLVVQAAQCREDMSAHLSSMTRTGVGLAWGIVAAVGVAFLLTPLAPVGIGLLLFSAVGGLATTIGFHLWEKRQTAIRQSKIQATKKSTHQEIHQEDTERIARALVGEKGEKTLLESLAYLSEGKEEGADKNAVDHSGTVNIEIAKKTLNEKVVNATNKEDEEREGDSRKPHA